MTQASTAYLLTALRNANATCAVTDLSGRVSYYAAPKELYVTVDSPLWSSPKAICDGEWMDAYLPRPTTVSQDVVLFSALFSPDVIFHARLSYVIKKTRPGVTTAIGGAALAGLRDAQLAIIARFFDYVLIGHNVGELLQPVLLSRHPGHPHEGEVIRAPSLPAFDPDYSLVALEDFVSVYTGHGCYYGRCRFCDYSARGFNDTVFRSPDQVARDLAQICRLRPTVQDVVLTQDSYTKRHLTETAAAIGRLDVRVPYNVMFRAEGWVSAEIGQLLAESGCTDVFIGAEALDNEILHVLNKGLGVSSIVAALRALSEYVDITIGLVLFVPGISVEALDRQRDAIVSILPLISAIEPEILTVVNGSAFAMQPDGFGIRLNVTEKLLNDSWCFGLSHDIPWTMADENLAKAWIAHAGELRQLCGGVVKPHYWDAIDEVTEQWE